MTVCAENVPLTPSTPDAWAVLIEAGKTMLGDNMILNASPMDNTAEVDYQHELLSPLITYIQVSYSVKKSNQQ